MKNDNSRHLKYIIICSLILATIFCLFFFIGIEITTRIFFATLGRPEGLGWLLLTFTSAVGGIIIGAMSNLSTTIVTGAYIHKHPEKYGKEGHPAIKIAGLAFLLSIVWILLIFAIAGKLIPPCANCYR